MRYFDTVGFDGLPYNNLLLHSDSVSGDRLFYSFEINSELVFTNIIIVINEKYDYPFTFEERTTATVAHYTIAYQKKLSETDLPDIVSAEYRGEIKVQTETVYFTYTQTIATDDADFLADIQSLIQVKE